MGGEPKRRYAKARQGKRRSHHALALPPVELCPRCHQTKLCHHVCPTCGTYGGEQIIEVKGKKKK
ncbi:MAG: 50S ribosomal protein L32 [Chloroflexi bacterium]|nr:MAG: 50S ribosomal protein L32 [Chloroflexota bacterium]RLC97159.1 MAG: 50S ribosomal protein L32 [Chloroflexota bacterium]